MNIQRSLFVIFAGSLLAWYINALALRMRCYCYEQWKDYSEALAPDDASLSFGCEDDAMDFGEIINRRRSALL